MPTPPTPPASEGRRHSGGIQVISNSQAGTNEDAQLRAAVAELAVSGTDAVEVVSAGNAADLDKLLERGYSTVIVAGGDGSLHAVVNALYRRSELAERTIGLIPLGTGNDFARGMDIPLAPQRAAATFLNGLSRPMDLFVDDAGEVTVNAVHLGVGADSTLQAARWKQALGPMSFPVGGLIAGWAAQGYRLRVEADGDVVIGAHHKTLLVGLANGRFVGGGAGTLDPDARPDDGDISLVVSRSRGFWRRTAHAIRVHRGTHPLEIDVHRRRARTVSVFGEPVTASNDGEIHREITARTWTVLPGAWNFVAVAQALTGEREPDQPPA
ncbi:diacylglycerol/lipid kinase family protein [Salinactinospora qingdaonensis]|uniref:Diacylglycerol kinase family lipid kinase n=1 Tax=Salinactinospora qingdaonensis TaxID=702744 RepID=A0ABP7EVF2_9ACTN